MRYPRRNCEMPSRSAPWLQRIRTLTVSALQLLLALPAAATSIEFNVADLPDVAPGEDLWRYSYFVSDFTTGSGFTIFFDYQLFTSLESPPPVVNADWDVITLQPDPNLPDDGAYDALALTSNPSLGDPFEVSFVWAGPGSPGSQPFVVFNALFQTIETGQTTLVPEPGVSTLVAMGLLFLAAARRREAATRYTQPGRARR